MVSFRSQPSFGKVRFYFVLAFSFALLQSGLRPLLTIHGRRSEGGGGIFKESQACYDLYRTVIYTHIRSKLFKAQFKSLSSIGCRRRSRSPLLQHNTDGGPSPIASVSRSVYLNSPLYGSFLSLSASLLLDTAGCSK